MTCGSVAHINTDISFFHHNPSTCSYGLLKDLLSMEVKAGMYPHSFENRCEAYMRHQQCGYLTRAVFLEH